MLKNKIDGSVFESEQDAFEHFKSTYLEEHTEQSLVSSTEIYSRIHSAFPDGSLSVTKNSYHDGLYDVALNMGYASYENWVSEGNNDTSEVLTIEEFISHFKRVDSDVCSILEAARNTYGFSNFKFERFHDDYGNGYYIDFSHEYGCEYYKGEGVDNFIKTLSQYKIEKLEGEVNELRDSGYFDGWAINGIPLAGIFNRGKKVRVEIIE